MGLAGRCSPVHFSPLMKAHRLASTAGQREGMKGRAHVRRPRQHPRDARHAPQYRRGQRGSSKIPVEVLHQPQDGWKGAALKREVNASGKGDEGRRGARPDGRGWVSVAAGEVR